jgi:formiminoglutamate deiminase
MSDSAASVGSAAPAAGLRSRPERDAPRVRRDGGTLVLPGIATAHSHAFQRALRARTQRLRGTAGATADATGGGTSFWSWRGLMYALAERLTPEDLYDLSHFAFVELALSGVTAVGEFHYLHHQPGGAPYADRTLLAETVIRAARDAGLRIVLLRVAYARAGFGRALEGPQRRFRDLDPDDVLRDVETLRARHAADPQVSIGLAPHSVRAVPRAWLGPLAAHARAHALPLHAHVSEQRREVQECLAEHGLRPVELLAAEGALGDRLVAVHATHLTDSEARLLGAASASVCVCRTTERDLGDGAPALGRLRGAGARLCVGVDSHAASDPFEEARAMELDERTRVEVRQVALGAPELLRALGANGYAALGLRGLEAEDEVRLEAADPAFAGALAESAARGDRAGDGAARGEREGEDDGQLDEAVAWCATARAVREVRVAGRPIVEGGVHPAAGRARERFDAAVARLLRGG